MWKRKNLSLLKKSLKKAKKIKVLVISPSSFGGKREFFSSIKLGEKEGFEFFAYIPEKETLFELKDAYKVLEERMRLRLSEVSRIKALEIKFSLEQNEFKFIMALRGGFFSNLIYNEMKKLKISESHTGKLFSGGSDFSFVKFILKKFSKNSDFLYFPMLLSDFKSEKRIKKIKKIFDMYDRGIKRRVRLRYSHVIRDGIVEGKSFLSCLTMFSNSVGTGYEPDIEGKVLFLEDINESPERIIRMLTHLKDSGVFNKVGGVVFSDFLLKGREKRKLIFYLKDFFEDFNYGVYFGCNFGHREGREYVFDGMEIGVNYDKGIIYLA